MIRTPTREIKPQSIENTQGGTENEPNRSPFYRHPVVEKVVPDKQEERIGNHGRVAQNQNGLTMTEDPANRRQNASGYKKYQGEV